MYLFLLVMMEELKILESKKEVLEKMLRNSSLEHFSSAKIF